MKRPSVAARLASMKVLLICAAVPGLVPLFVVPLCSYLVVSPDGSMGWFVVVALIALVFLVSLPVAGWSAPASGPTFTNEREAGCGTEICR